MPKKSKRIRSYTTPVSNSVPIRIPDVERELANLWNDAKDADSAGPPVTRTVLLNLVAYCRDQATVHKVSQTIAAVTADHPCRAIIIYSDRERQESEISARVSIACQLVSRGDKQVCGEHIFVDAHNVELRKIIGTVLPLTLPDLPVVFWLPGRVLSSDDLFASIAQVSDRIIIDSRLTDDPSRLHRWIGACRVNNPLTVVDLAWVRLDKARLCIARQFDSQRWRACLPEIMEMVFHYPADDSFLLNDALLLGSWLASTLKWSGLSSSKQDGGEYLSLDGRKLKLHSREDLPSGLLKVLLKSGDTAFHFEISPSAAISRVVEGDEPRDEQAGSLRELTEAQIFCGALEISRPDPVYLKTIEFIGEIYGRQRQ